MSIASFLSGKKKVLLVEDDATLRSAVKDKFIEKGCTVFEAGDARDVLRIVATEKPDAIVLDLILPLKDGISLLEELRKEGHTVPVLILSNLLGSEDLRKDAERLEAAFYNKSSTSLDTIVQAVTDKLS